MVLCLNGGFVVLLEFWLSSMVVGLIGCYGFVGFALWFDVKEVLADLMGVFWGLCLMGIYGNCVYRL
jgi:hypothetical protein